MTKCPEMPVSMAAKSAGIPSEVDHDAVGVSVRVECLLELTIDGRHPDVEANHPGGKPTGNRPPLGFDATNIVGRCPTVTGCPVSGRRSTVRS